MEDKKKYIETLKQVLENKLKAKKINYSQALKESLKLNENLLSELSKSNQIFLSFYR